MFNFLGNLSSVVGLFFSALAFVFSKRASAAAREARDVAFRQSLGEDMNGASRTAAEIVAHLRSDRSEMALLRIGDLMDRTSFIEARWNTRLSEKSKNNLLEASEELRSMHKVLTKSLSSELAARQKAGLAEASQRVSAIFSAEHGAATESMEAKEQ